MMPLHPHRRCDDRRRRLLQGEILAEQADDADASTREAESKNAGRKRSRYAKAADMIEQARVTDLVPARKITLAALFLLGLAVIAGLEWLYSWMPAVAAATTDGRVAAFDLDGEGSLAAWFSSVVLALAGLTALLVYSLRRHRLDDYHGRYLIWLWAAACWFVMSVDEAGSLHEGFKELMVYLTGKRLYGDGSLWWVMAYGCVLGLVGMLLLWDMRECRFAALSFVSCGLCYVAAVATQMGLILPDLGAKSVMFEEGCEMTGNLLLLLAMATQARYLIRDINGLVVKKTRKKTTKRSGKTKKPADTSTAKPTPSAASAATEAKPLKQKQTVVARQREDAATSSPPPPTGKMTKAQRRAARRREEQRRQDW